ncbi:MAG: Carbamate kinase [Candidatus Bathyarchaeota archaeon BA1]|nr:MAG: Carbamate kinase [Candidatus Bathyarchaeota archaeon BA1]
MGKRILVALGGNAIKQADEKGTPEEQFRNCMITCKLLAEIVKRMGKDDRLIITHGNGPQAGNLMVQQEEAKYIVPPQTMDIVGAMTQGQIGYMLQQTLMNCLRDMGIDTPVCAVVNQVLVYRNDPDFFGEAASKPVGNFFTEEEATKIKKEHPEYIIKKVKPTGDRVWRRCVPSPDPMANVESVAIRKLVDAGAIVIASGGGGIPVILDEHGHYKGVEAVIDKDLAGERLAEVIDADVFLILTDVEKVRLNFGRPNEKEIDRMTLTEAKKFLGEGHFLPGSMGPKVKACIRFLEWGGEKAIITSLNKAVQALEGRTGTLIYRG